MRLTRISPLGLRCTVYSVASLKLDRNGTTGPRNSRVRWSSTVPQRRGADRLRHLRPLRILRAPPRPAPPSPGLPGLRSQALSTSAARSSHVVAMIPMVTGRAIEGARPWVADALPGQLETFGRAAAPSRRPAGHLSRARHRGIPRFAAIPSPRRPGRGRPRRAWRSCSRPRRRRELPSRASAATRCPASCHDLLQPGGGPVPSTRRDHLGELPPSSTENACGFLPSDVHTPDRQRLRFRSFRPILTCEN